MDSLKSIDPELHSFLNLADFFGSAFIAKPRLLELTTFMLHRVRDQLGIYWQTWGKLPCSWNERWHEAGNWFQAAIDCFKDQKGGYLPLPTSIIELARDFDFIEESCRRIYGGELFTLICTG